MRPLSPAFLFAREVEPYLTSSTSAVPRSAIDFSHLKNGSQVQPSQEALSDLMVRLWRLVPLNSRFFAMSTSKLTSSRTRSPTSKPSLQPIASSMPRIPMLQTRPYLTSEEPKEW
mmetsp:Transcript_90069/g.155960  ORF Transcript_90069/g.155960 Transcript_90069/m.155960 type:complete len:115 (-) Transcript_90069:37-381(-)